ncbi:hypothetical protein HAX54_027798 [Datura stramonium]|uniref:Protein kinase domain-containing protein n=1 Tax=Datura stramonium TaxID=4076 RepID=A0ABS8V350_DATST|nr:hypothetical protein [Datura stramonium]
MNGTNSSFDGQTLSLAYFGQFMKLEHNGHLWIYRFDRGELDWKVEYDVGRNFFRPSIGRKANLGCTELTSISCDSLQYHSLLETIRREETRPQFFSRCRISHQSFLEEEFRPFKVIVGSIFAALMGRFQQSSVKEDLALYEGTLSNGTKIAVKHLDGLGQVKDSFLTEVNIVGSIHHVNLVKLIGFCAEKSERLLIYEYMINGSLDRWIYHKNQASGLTWHKAIISDIAKGLAYLHEDCSHKIIHLDIKPQNILLDQCFNAKISDFGLSKLIEKEKSKVVTRMRGTPGYLAPEWLSSVITEEKVDVYFWNCALGNSLWRKEFRLVPS